MKGRLFWCLLAYCLACLPSLAYAAPQNPIEVPAEATAVPIWPGLQIVVSADLALAPERAAELAQEAGARRVDSPDRIFGRGTPPVWAWFSLHNAGASTQTRFLALESTTQFDTRLIQRDDAGAWHQVQTLTDSAAGRIGGGTTHPVWELQLAPHQTRVLLLRIEGPAIVRFPVFLYQPASFAERERKTHILMGLAVGICLLIGVYIGSLRHYLDDASVPLFIGMLVADMVGALWLSGFLRELFPAVSEQVFSAVGFTAYATLSGCGSLHARVYLGTATWAPRADRLLQVLGWFSLALIPWFAMAFPVAARIFLVVGGAAIAFVVIAISVLASYRRVPFSGFIAAAWLAYLAVSFSFLLARVVNDPQLWSPAALSLIQATVTAIFFGLAMSQRLMHQRDVLVAAHQDALMQREKSAALMRERSLFFAATAHDLRQPLVGVGLFAYLLKSARTPAEQENHARKLDMALKEVDGLLVGIQQLAAVNEASHHPKLETVALDTLLAPIVEEYRGRAEHKRITIRYVPSRLAITTHIPYFQRIVRNVLSNAIRYTDQGDRVLVGCRRGGGLRLVIADTGHGMTEAQTRQAFDAFQRFDAEMTFPDGFGLGLFSTKSLAHALGMTVDLRSHKGRGTEFRIFIPATMGNGINDK